MDDEAINFKICNLVNQKRKEAKDTRLHFFGQNQTHKEKAHAKVLQAQQPVHHQEEHFLAKEKKSDVHFAMLKPNDKGGKKPVAKKDAAAAAGRGGGAPQAKEAPFEEEPPGEADSARREGTVEESRAQEKDSQREGLQNGGPQKGEPQNGGSQNGGPQNGGPQNCDFQRCSSANCPPHSSNEPCRCAQSHSTEKQPFGEKGKKNKKGTNVNYIVHYNRYKPTRVPPTFSKSKGNPPVVKKNKNQYINCNFRYYVKEKNYLTQSVDEHIKWEQIEKVDYIVFDNTKLACPICLEDKIISPRITKCRHIFCFFCILKYFIDENDENKKMWKKCPICFEIINENDLRAVKFHYVKNYSINDSISMCLLYTEDKKIHLKSDRLYFNNSFKVTNKNFVKHTKTGDYKYFVHIDYMNKNLTTFSRNHTNKISKLNLNLGIQFSKLFYLYNPLSIWIKDLHIFNFILKNKQMHLVASDTNVIQKAIENIKLKISEYLNIPIERMNPELNLDERSFDSFYLYDNLAHDVYDSIEQIKQEMDIETELAKNQKSPVEEKCPLDGEKPADEGSPDLKHLNQTYFYQCIDGQCIFLDPFILNLLFFECDNYMNRMPKFLCNRQITYIETFELDEKIRKRHAILSHLPLGVNVLFVSFNIDDLLSERTKTHFSKEISERKKKHHSILRKKMKEEKYFKLLADEEIDRKEKRYWNLPNNTINIQSDTISISSGMLRHPNLLDEEKYLHGELDGDWVVKQNECAFVEHLFANVNWDNQPGGTSTGGRQKSGLKRGPKNGLTGAAGSNGPSGPTWPKKDPPVNRDNAADPNVCHIPKRSFLEIAKQKSDAGDVKSEMGKKKEEQLSIGSGSVHVNLIDLINTKTAKKKKRK
ncbi:E3 ubiquitin-protein ligase, putative [Plasmodium vivax]|uniref:E3 ubiquitin-protein ligase, putative n=1 Tax=Plasmodium vivax TaxID=5855 RepID=A0A1G4GW79_PLAVI|nr:RING zinc finger protein, putative [Plasmodium vivax]SCO66837.1 E3 ubiquitin-protein ligase, putative [Plasmodium vivax]SCO72265.1 E3 ubiquitin-protein ligase, putative [Plasmodium vivax]